MKRSVNPLLQVAAPGRPTPKSSVVATVAILLVALLVSGCGWHLRGYGDAPQTFSSIYIGSKNSHSELVRELGRAFKSQGIDVKANANEAEYGLIIIDERRKRRTATVSGSARISEQELTESVDYSVLNSDGSIALPLTTATVDRIFEYNEDNILATDDEAQLLRREMQRDLVRQMLNRLQNLGKTSASSTTPGNDATTP